MATTTETIEGCSGCCGNCCYPVFVFVLTGTKANETFDVQFGEFYSFTVTDNIVGCGGTYRAYIIRPSTAYGQDVVDYFTTLYGASCVSVTDLYTVGSEPWEIVSSGCDDFTVEGSCTTPTLHVFNSTLASASISTSRIFSSCGEGGSLIVYGPGLGDFDEANWPCCQCGLGILYDDTPPYTVPNIALVAGAGYMSLCDPGVSECNDFCSISNFGGIPGSTNSNDGVLITIGSSASMAAGCVGYDYSIDMCFEDPPDASCTDGMAFFGGLRPKITITFSDRKVTSFVMAVGSENYGTLPITMEAWDENGDYYTDTGSIDSAAWSSGLSAGQVAYQAYNHHSISKVAFQFDAGTPGPGGIFIQHMQLCSRA